jgi:uncharacterized coiled-coil protein SlyX
MDNADLPTFNPHDVMRHLADLGQRMKDAQARIKGMETKVSQQGHVLSEVRTGCASTRRYTQKTRSDHNSLGMAYADLKQRVERLEAWTREEIFARTAMDEPDDDTLPATPAPEPEDEAEKWEAVARAGYGAWHHKDGGGRADWPGQDEYHRAAEVAYSKAAVAKAIALGLAAPADRAELARWAKSYKDDDEGDPNVLNVLASFLRERSRGIGWYDAMDFALSLHEPPADRVVCAVDNTAIDGATRVHGNHTAMGATPRQAMHEALDYVAGYWTGTAPAGADTEGGEG